MLQVVPGDQINVAIGSGGLWSTELDTPVPGGTTIIGSASAQGGWSGIYLSSGRSAGSGGNGGSGGGGGGFVNSTYQILIAGDGGVDGSDGKRGTILAGDVSYQYSYASPGIGQHTTTRAFGESNGTLYSTGGGGEGTTPFHTNNGGMGNENPSTGNGARGIYSGYGSFYYVKDQITGASGIGIIRWG